MNHLDNDSEVKSFSEFNHEKAQDKRKAEEKQFTIVAVVMYSLLLLAVVIATYVGVKVYITAHRTGKPVAKKEVEEVVEEPETEEEEIPDQDLETEEEPEPEEEGVVWEDLVFSRIESPDNSPYAEVNSFNFTRKYSYNENGHTMDYEIYTNPANDDIEKIKSVENCGDLFEIIDYYYFDGKVNYIAQYSEVINLPVNLSSADVESRYYFMDDKLVKYIYCENEKATEYSVNDFSKYSEGTIGQYEYLENMMLEKAKNIWNSVDSLEENVSIEGYILDEFNQVLADNWVMLIDENGNIVSETQTNGDGFYSFQVKANDSRIYSLRAYRETLNEVNVYNLKAVKGAKKIAVPTIYMAYENNENPYLAQVFVKDADDANVALTDAEIRFRNGLDCRSGDAFMSGNLGEFGYIAPAIRSGCYTAEVTKEGYEPLYFNFIVKDDHQAVVAFAVKKLAEGEIRAVLDWEANPLDLDIRGYSSNAVNSFISSVDSVGSTNAETIDILNAGPDAYYLYVSDFTNACTDNYMSYGMADCNASLAVYNENGLIGNYAVPVAHAGIVWSPVEIRNGKVIPINDYYSNLESDSLFKRKR